MDDFGTLTDGDTFTITLRTTRHYAQFNGDQIVCLCGKKSDDAWKLANAHNRSGRALPGIYRLDGWTVSTGSTGVTVTFPADRRARHGDAVAVATFSLGKADADRLVPVSHRTADGQDVFRFKIAAPKL